MRGPVRRARLVTPARKPAANGLVVLQGPAAPVPVAVIPVALTLAVLLGKTAATISVAATLVVATPVVIPGKRAAKLAVVVTLVAAALVVEAAY